MRNCRVLGMLTLSALFRYCSFVILRTKYVSLDDIPIQCFLNAGMAKSICWSTIQNVRWHGLSHSWSELLRNIAEFLSSIVLLLNGSMVQIAW
jgi:hypothetical protein